MSTIFSLIKRVEWGLAQDLLRKEQKMAISPRYKVFIRPIGGMANTTVQQGLRAMGEGECDKVITYRGNPVAVYSITEDFLHQLLATMKSETWMKVEFYRKSIVTDVVTKVPAKFFSTGKQSAGGKITQAIHARKKNK